ncbi:MAG: hypothetical protein VKK04_03840 [Synechococcales bacterium]|nr:hypothetical protein [Synechococcales bacterium]
MGRRWVLPVALLVPLYFGGVTILYAFSHGYIVQDDARLHIVWLQRFVDPRLFPQDAIANYYTSLQAVGFRLIYQAIAHLGLDPLVAAKCLPLPLALVATGYLVRLTAWLWPHPLAGLLVALVFNQNVWLKDDLVSATPRAFVYPLFAAFLYYLVRRSPLPCLGVMALQGLIYPQLLLVSMATLTVQWTRGRLTRSAQRGDGRLWLLGLGLTVAIALLFSRSVSQEWGELATAAQMRAMPEFAVGGRRPYFGVSPLDFWFRGASGLRFPLFPPILWVAVGLPLLLVGRRQGKWQLAPVPAIAPPVVVLVDVLLGSLGLFVLAHALFPRLYLPSRYTFYSSRLVMAIAAGLVLAWLVDLGWRWWQMGRSRPGGLSPRHRLGGALVGLFAIAVIALPAIPPLFLDTHGWVIGTHPGLYRFLAAQPTDTLIASLSAEASNLPAFTQRSVLVSEEVAIAYHPRFYRQMAERMAALVDLHYSPDRATVRTVIQRYGIDYVLVESQFASPDYLTRQTWLTHSVVQPSVEGAIAQLQDTPPALSSTIPHCTVFAEADLILLSAPCIGG